MVQKPGSGGGGVRKVGGGGEGGTNICRVPTTVLRILHRYLILTVASTLSGRYYPSLLLEVRKLSLRKVR